MYYLGIASEKTRKVYGRTDFVYYLCNLNRKNRTDLKLLMNTYEYQKLLDLI